MTHRAKPNQGKVSYAGHYMQVGAKAETLVYNWLSNRPAIARIEDLRDDPKWRSQDVDFLVCTTSGQEYHIEVKSDWHLGVSGNVLFELSRIYNDNVVNGWTGKTPAQYILYYAPQISELWTIKTNDLRIAISAYLQDVGQKANIRIVLTDESKTTVNVLIPETYFERKIYKHPMKD